MPTGVYKRTEEHKRATLDSLAKARIAQAKMPRSPAQIKAFEKARSKGHEIGTYLVASEAATKCRDSRQLAFNQAELNRRERLELAKTAIDPMSELGQLISEQSKDQKSVQWGSLRTLSLDAPINEEGLRLYDILAVKDYQEDREERLISLTGY